MADEDGKTEKPTGKRLRESRKQGQFARTQDASTWIGIACGAAMLPSAIASLAGAFTSLLKDLPQMAGEQGPQRLFATMGSLPGILLHVAGPICVAAVAGSVLATAAQGVHPSGSLVKVKFKQLNPGPGIKRMFGMRALWEAGKALAKVGVVAAVVFSIATSLIPAMLGAQLPLAVVLERTRSAVMTLLFSAVATGLVMAVADYAYQRHTTMKKLKMSPREIKDEHKQADGDPLIKSAIRQRQMAVSRNRMLSAVSSADVVVVNPTHYAIALKYDPIKGAPRVIAKGAGSLALKIRARARAARVPVVEDKPLTRTLYRLCELGDEIPSELYLAVARILAFVMSAGRPSPTATPRRTAPSLVPDLPSKSGLRARIAKERRQARAAQRQQMATAGPGPAGSAGSAARAGGATVQQNV